MYMLNRKPKVALAVSHPIQHFCPMYANWAKSERFEFKVFFMSALGYKAYADKNFGKTIAWDNLRLEEFDHYFKTEEAIKVSKKESAGELLKELANYNPDAVVSYGYAQKFQREVKSWVNRQNKKLYYISDSELHNEELAIKRSLKSKWLKLYFKTVDRFLTVGSANEFYYRKNGAAPFQLTRMNFSIDLEQYETVYKQKEEHRKKIREKHQLNEDEFVCSVVGKLVSWKSQDHIIEALKKIDSPDHEKITCFIIGTGPESEKFQELAKSLKHHQVIFTGFVNPTELSSYYAASDIYLHPAHHEPHSLAISEAIYLGVPAIISSTCGSYGPYDDVMDGYNGFVYPTGNFDAMLVKVKVLQQDKELRAQFGERARDYAVEAQKLSHFTAIETALTADGFL